jgi:hypothetical protein
MRHDKHLQPSGHVRPIKYNGEMTRVIRTLRLIDDDLAACFRRPSVTWFRTGKLRRGYRRRADDHHGPWTERRSTMRVTMRPRAGLANRVEPGA